jgi:hypothetical protein
MGRPASLFHDRLDEAPKFFVDDEISDKAKIKKSEDAHASIECRVLQDWREVIRG